MNLAIDLTNPTNIGRILVLNEMLNDDEEVTSTKVVPKVVTKSPSAPEPAETTAPTVDTAQTPDAWSCTLNLPSGTNANEYECIVQAKESPSSVDPLGFGFFLVGVVLIIGAVILHDMQKPRGGRK